MWPDIVFEAILTASVAVASWVAGLDNGNAVTARSAAS